MKTAIKIVAENGTNWVNSRELHQLLEVGKDYSTWIKDRIRDFSFTENEDFYIKKNHSPKLGNLSAKGLRTKIDYFINIDMAKELAMLERNVIGRKVRKYFIAVEKQARQNMIAMPKPLNVYGMDALPYDWWLLQNGYSVSSGQRSKRIKKYPEHFYKSSTGKWYINKQYAKALLAYRQGKNQLKQIEALPQLNQLQMF